MKSLVCGAASIAVACGWAFAASAAKPSSHPHLEPPGWVIAPGEAVCRTDLELTGRSGAVSPVSLISDGGQIRLRFAMEEVPERAFLPIRIDQKAYANLVVRGDVAKVAIMALSEETLAALRKGGTLQIAWLSEEPVRVSLAGAAQAIADLRTCGAQVGPRRWLTSSSPPPAPRPPPPRLSASGCAPRPIEPPTRPSRPRPKPSASAPWRWPTSSAPTSSAAAPTPATPTPIAMTTRTSRRRSGFRRARSTATAPTTPAPTASG